MSITSSKNKNRTMSSWAPTFVVGSDDDDSHEKKDTHTTASPQDRPQSVVVMPNKQRRYCQHQSLLSPLSSPATSTTKTLSPTTPSPKKTPWQSSVFVAAKEDCELAESDTDSSHGQMNPQELLQATMTQTKLEWNQHRIAKAFQPYKDMICALDPDNFPNQGDDRNDIQNLLDGGNSTQDDFYGGIFCKDGDQKATDIRHVMMQDPQLHEREIAAFFEGMRLYQIKVNSLQAQLRVQQQQHRCRASMVFSAVPQKSTTPGIVATAPKRASIAAPSSSWTPPLVSARDSQDDSSRESKDTKPIPRTYGKSLRAMSIARIQSRVNAMHDDTAKGFPLLDKSNHNEITGKKEDIQRLLHELQEAEKKQRFLEKQLKQAGVVIAEDIPYDFAKEKVTAIAKRMTEIGSSDVEDRALREEYFKLEQEMEKYTTALQLTDEWVQEQEELERQWETSITSANEEALRKVCRHMPVNVRNMSEAALSSQPSPNGKFLPKSIAKRFKRTNCLQLLRIDPEDIVKMHPSILENMRVTGLTLTERRAIYHHLKDVGPRWKAMQSDKMTERKWNWYCMMRSNFKENVDAWQRHIDMYGPPDNHPYATRENPHSGCPLIGKQCPLKADKVVDYAGDYGFPEGPEYFKTHVTKSEVDNVAKAKQEALEAAREKKGTERREALKHHYKGKLQQVSKAVGTCDAMDDTLDKLESIQEKQIGNELTNGSTGSAISDESAKKEVVLFDEALNELKLPLFSFAERSGMQLKGQRDSESDQPDTRSVLESSLCEEVVEAALYFFRGIEERMATLQIKDGRIKSSMQQLREVLDELHTRNLQNIEKLSPSEECPAPSRRLKTRETIKARLQKALDESSKTTESSSVKSNAEQPIPSGDAPNGLMAALRRSSTDAGRGGLMAALKSRGDGRGDDGGRGGLMAAIAARGAVQ